MKALLLNIKIDKADLIKERASQFCEKYLALNASLHNSEIFLDSDIVEEIRGVYKPYFDLAQESLASGGASFDLASTLPNTMEEIVEIGNEPRKRVVKAFKEISGIDA